MVLRDFDILLRAILQVLNFTSAFVNISENKFCLIVGLQNMNIFSEWVKDGAFHRQYFTLASGCCYRSVWILCHDWHLTGALAFWAAGKAVTVNQSAAKHIGTVCYRDLLYNGNAHVLDRVRNSLTDNTHTHQHTDKHPHTDSVRERERESESHVVTYLRNTWWRYFISGD